MRRVLPFVSPLHSRGERIWIPPGSLLAGQLAHGLSWIMLIALAARGEIGTSFPGLAWVHLVALEFLTLVALGVLVHVLHGFLDLEWVGEGIARWALLPFALGAWALAACFWLGRLDGLPIAGAILAVGLVGYLVPAGISLVRFRPADKSDTAVRRAFSIVLTFLALTAIAGLAMAGALAYGGSAWVLSALPAIHAHLGGLGWLTILVLGVSVRTVKPITGDRSPYVWLHIVASTALFVGVVVLAVGLGLALTPLSWLGGLLSALGAIVYVLDLGLVLVRARVPHRPPQAFLAAAAVWFLVAAALGLGALAGHVEWQPAYAFVALIGWLGQMVNGHLHHIGVRVLLTMARGAEDETRPQDVLIAPLSWGAWAASQLAVLAVLAGLLLGHAPIAGLGAILGLIGWIAMGANILGAWRRAVSPLP